MSRIEITEQKFRKLVSSYGANQDRWPEAERLAMLGFIKAQPNAQDILNEAMSLDGLLNQLATPKAADHDFLERLSVMAAPRKQAAKGWGFDTIFKNFPSFSLYGFMPRAVGLASICAVGIMLGLSNVARHDVGVTNIDASALMFSNSSIAKDIEEMD
jgi:hypothetical protein